MKNLIELKKRIAICCVAAVVFFSCTDPMGAEQVDSMVTNSLDQQVSRALDLLYDDPDAAVKLCNDIIARANEQGLPFYSGKAKWYLGYLYDDVSQDVSKAYFYYNEAILDLKKTDSYALLQSVYLNLGELNRANGHYVKAVEIYEEAMEYEDEFTHEQLADLYYNYGVALKFLGDDTSFEAAQRAIERSLAIAKEIDNHEDIARVNNQIGLMYKDVGNYEMARIAYTNTIRDYASDPQLKEFAGKAYHGIGVTYMEEGNWQESIKAFKQALAYKTNSRSIFVSMYDLGTVQMQAGLQSQAIGTWKSALDEDHNKNDMEHVKIYASLTKALSAQNKHEEALAYAQMYNDNIQNILDGTEIASNHMNDVLFADVVREYEEFRQPGAVPFVQNVSTIVMFAVLAVLMLSIVGLYIKYRSRRKQSAAFSELQAKFEQFKVD